MMKRVFLSAVAVVMAIVGRAGSPGQVFGFFYEGSTLNYRILSDTTCEVYNVYYVDGSVVIPSYVNYFSDEYEVVSLGDNSLSRNVGYYPNNITSVEIPSTVQTIGKEAFYQCRSLNTVYLGDCVKSIGDLAFANCEDLTWIEIPNSVVSIGGGCFLGCKQLTQVDLGESLSSIGGSAFSSCRRLERINVDSKNETYKSVNGILFKKDGSEICAYPAGKSATTYKVPADVKRIGNDAFIDCEKLTAIVLPETLTSIGVSAFLDCKGLRKMTLPNSVKTIENNAFKGCLALDSILFPKSLVTIGDYAFSECEELETVIIPNSVQEIGMRAFRYCRGLKSVTLGQSLKSVPEDAFAGCSNIREVKYAAIDPVAAPNSYYENLFDKEVYNEAVLYVPRVAVEKAAKTSPWCLFKKIEGYDFTDADFGGVDGVMADVADGPTEVYDLNGVSVGSSTEGLAKGLYIVRRGSTVKKVAVK